MRGASCGPSGGGGGTASGQEAVENSLEADADALGFGCVGDCGLVVALMVAGPLGQAAQEPKPPTMPPPPEVVAHHHATEDGGRTMWMMM